MQLYKMELYKIFHRKIFWIGILAILGLMFVYFWFAEVGDERCVIDGRSYSGYEAVQMNKKITEEYAGTVTDEKINQIVDKYGLPSELNENMPGWKNGNYLNDFVTRFFTNGSWENGVKPTERYRLKDTDLWKYHDNLCDFRCFCRGKSEKDAAINLYNSGGEKEGYFSQSSGFFYDNSSVICRNYRKCMGIMQNRV